MYYINPAVVVCLSRFRHLSPGRWPSSQQHGLLPGPAKPSPQPRGQHLSQTADHSVARWAGAQLAVPDPQILLQHLRQPEVWTQAQCGSRTEEGSAPQRRGGEAQRGQGDGYAEVWGYPEGQPGWVCVPVHAVLPDHRSRWRHLHHHEHAGRTERCRRERCETGEEVAQMLLNAHNFVQRLPQFHVCRRATQERDGEQEPASGLQLHAAPQHL